MAATKKVTPTFLSLPRDFYQPSAEIVAAQLVGHWLVRNTPSGVAGGMIVETEAYLTDDPACHGAPGLTKRNRTMFGPPGYAYVYLIYGCHYCLNAVCDHPGVAEAVLIRAIEPLWGIDWILQNRGAIEKKQATNGPGKLCTALRIDRHHDGADLCDPISEIFIAENPQRRNAIAKLGPVLATTRVGITKAALLPLRFYLRDSEYVSRRPKIHPQPIP
jgi:DNA-3-methyladenine glycosylase